MSLLFDGVDDIVQETTAANFDVATVSLLAWIFPESIGEVAGRIFLLDSQLAFHLQTTAGTDKLRFFYDFDVTDGIWDTPASSITFNSWFCVAATYDRSSVLNDPLIYIRDLSAGAKILTLQTITEISTPATTAVSPGLGYMIGNNAATTRSFDGRIAYVQFWNRILTKNELEIAMNFPGRVTNGLVLFSPLYNTSGVDWSGNVLNATVTGAVVADNPPTAAPFGLGLGWPGAFKAAGTLTLQTIAATAIGVTTLTTRLTALITMAATAIGVAVLTKIVTFLQTLAATAVGVATLTTLFIAGAAVKIKRLLLLMGIGK